jgi:hypothetical protein
MLSFDWQTTFKELGGNLLEQVVEESHPHRHQQLIGVLT